MERWPQPCAARSDLFDLKDVWIGAFYLVVPLATLVDFCVKLVILVVVVVIVVMVGAHFLCLLLCFQLLSHLLFP